MSNSLQLDYLDSLGLHVIKPGLKRIKQILKHLGNPQDEFHSVIIGGTNGKGSTAAFISSILSKSEYKTALYTSPHLIKVNERISINNRNISDSNLNKIITLLRKECEDIDIKLSYFEFLTAAAFLYFAKKKVDIAVLEVGMGGRWDATNVITPLVSVITNISKDHMQYLGGTIAGIAKEKAEIIKADVPVVTACDNDSIKPLINKSKNSSSNMYRYGYDFSTLGLTTDDFEYRSKQGTYENLSCNLKGLHQSINIGLALKTIEILISKYHYEISESVIRKGLKNVKWKGRFEVLDKKRPVIIDCAHNEGSSRALVDGFKSYYPGIKFNFLIGMLDDKEHEYFIKNISKLADTIYITGGFSQRESDTKTLSEICDKLKLKHKIFQNYKTAAKRLILDSSSPLCICGSIYLIGGIMEYLNKHKRG